MTTYTVVTTDFKTTHKRVTVVDETRQSAERIHLRLHPYAQAAKGDRLSFDPAHQSRIFVISTEDEKDLIPITPHFEREDVLRIGAAAHSLRITEPISEEHNSSYKLLESFHYRSTTNIVNDDEAANSAAPQNIGGKKGILLACLKIGARWETIGYIELQMPLLMVKPRHVAFAEPYAHPTRPIKWETWDQHSIKSYVNCIVRIARIVISPEFRGLGLSRLLIGHAKQYATERWHIGGRRPLFMEILAEMLKYVNFVSSSDFQYMGLTEGNLKRVHSDLTHMQKHYEINSGIMSLQKKYLTKLTDGAKLIGRDLATMLNLLGQVSNDPNYLNSLQPAEYYVLKSVLRFPIPYYLCGLDESARALVSKMAQRESVSTASVDPQAEGGGHIAITELSVTSRYLLPKNPSVMAIMDAFGLKGDGLANRVIDSLKLDATEGNIIFISGPSGSGKSMLLRALDTSASDPQIEITRRFGAGNSYSVAWIKDLPVGIPLIEYFASKWGIERAIGGLNQVGLSEAYVYLKPYELLSRGQGYRARLAELILRNEQVWLVDEFCADLDPLTAKIVAANLRKHVMKHKRIAVIAAANHDHFLEALRPTRVIKLRHGFGPEIMTYKEFVDEFYPKSA